MRIDPAKHAGIRLSLLETSSNHQILTAAMLVKYLADLTLPIYYIAAPHAMGKTVNEAGVDDDNIPTEELSIEVEDLAMNSKTIMLSPMTLR